MTQLSFQRLELSLRIVIIAFVFRHFDKFVIHGIAQRIILEATFHNHLAEVLIVGIRKLEIGSRRDGWMTVYIVKDITVHHLRGVAHVGKIIYYVGQRIGSHLHVRLYASRILHLASIGRQKHLCQGVGNQFLAGTVRLSEVPCLYAPSAGDIVLVGSELHLRIVRQFEHGLHDALSVCACAKYHRTVHILQGTAYNLAGTCRSTVDKYNEWEQRVNGLH